jgi:hypothetical protein
MGAIVFRLLNQKFQLIQSKISIPNGLPIKIVAGAMYKLIFWAFGIMPRVVADKTVAGVSEEVYPVDGGRLQDDENRVTPSGMGEGIGLFHAFKLASIIAQLPRTECESAA